MNKPNHTYRPITVCSLFTAHHSQAANYAFASKERDVETGLSVTSLRSVSSLPLGHFRTSSNGTRWLRRFGARYYSSDLSIWLSVDPMVDKYPSFSPYVYCANNPIKLVDPNGEDWYESEDGKMHYTLEYTSKNSFEQSGIKGTYQGKTCTKNGQYYSLFGQTLDANSKRGKLTQKIDNAFMNYASYLKSNSSSSSKDNPFDVEIHSWESPSQNETDFSGVFPFVPHSIGDNYHNPNELGNYAGTAGMYLFVTGERMKGKFDSFSIGYEISSIGGNNGWKKITGNLLQFKNYSGNIENSIVVLRFSSSESLRNFQNKFNKLFDIK